jgi:hypothetical protein
VLLHEGREDGKKKLGVKVFFLWVLYLSCWMDLMVEDCAAVRAAENSAAEDPSCSCPEDPNVKSRHEFINIHAL